MSKGKKHRRGDKERRAHGRTRYPADKALADKMFQEKHALAIAERDREKEREADAAFDAKPKKRENPYFWQGDILCRRDLSKASKGGFEQIAHASQFPGLHAMRMAMVLRIKKRQHQSELVGMPGVDGVGIAGGKLVIWTQEGRELDLPPDLRRSLAAASIEIDYRDGKTLPKKIIRV